MLASYIILVHTSIKYIREYCYVCSMYVSYFYFLHLFTFTTTSYCLLMRSSVLSTSNCDATPATTLSLALPASHLPCFRSPSHPAGHQPFFNYTTSRTLKCKQPSKAESYERGFNFLSGRQASRAGTHYALAGCISE